MRAVAYVRVSTDEQAREGRSLAAQEHAIRARCEAEDWTVAAIYEDAGISGATLERPGLIAALEAADTYDVLIVWAQDRLSRDTIGYLTVLEALDRSGARLLSLQEGWLEATEDGEFVGTIFAARSRWERRRIARRIQQGLAQRAREGDLVGPLPLGYERLDGVVRPSPAAPFVLAAFERYAGGGDSLRDLAAWARQQGHDVDRLGVRKLLTNRTYTGAVVWHARSKDAATYKGRHAAIIDSALFEAVQRRLAARRRGGSTRSWGRSPYPLSGIARCAHCGSAMVGVRSSKRPSRYMRCGRAQRLGRDACAQRMVPAAVFEEQVGAYLGGMVLPDEWAGAIVSVWDAAVRPPERPPAYQRAAGAYRQLRAVGEIDAAELRRRMQRLEARFGQASDVLVDTEQALALLRDMPRIWETTDDTGRRAIAVEVFERLRVRGRWVAALTPQAAYAPLFVHDRHARFGGEMGCGGGGVVWLPGQDLNLQPSG